MSATVVVTVVPPGENKLISVTESQRVPDHLAVPVVSGGRVQVLSGSPAVSNCNRHVPTHALW